MKLGTEGLDARLSEMMEQLWDRLSKTSEVNDFVRYQAETEWVLSPSDPYTPLVALGNFNDALDAMQKVLRFYAAGEEHERNEEVISQREALRKLARRLEHEPSRVYELLHEFEERNVKYYGLQEYWEPSPFPGELE